MQVKEILPNAASQLRLISTTPELDAELLLAYVLHKDRTFLHTWPEYELSGAESSRFSMQLQRRMSGEPVAYILGHKEFWSLTLNVNSNVLIPRAETELLVEIVLNNFTSCEIKSLADLGTGSGAVGLAIAHERPDWKITATDISKEALLVARENAAKLNINNVDFYEGDWCAALPTSSYDIIVSNPPYIAEDDPHLQSSIRYEPKTALVSGNNGLHDLRKIIEQAKHKLVVGGMLILEHGFDQSSALAALLQQDGYCDIEHYSDLAGHVRATSAHLNGYN